MNKVGKKFEPGSLKKGSIAHVRLARGGGSQTGEAGGRAADFHPLPLERTNQKEGEREEKTCSKVEVFAV